jgi:hypothetical protein
MPSTKKNVCSPKNEIQEEAKEVVNDITWKSKHTERSFFFHYVGEWVTGSFFFEKLNVFIIKLVNRIIFYKKNPGHFHRMARIFYIQRKDTLRCLPLT